MPIIIVMTRFQFHKGTIKTALMLLLKLIKNISIP